MTEDSSLERNLPWYDQPDVPERIRQLVALRDIGVHGLNDKPASDSLERFSELNDAAMALQINIGVQSLFKRIENLLRAAIDSLDDDKYCEAALWTFQLTAGSVSKKHSNEWRKAAADVIHISLDRWRRGPAYEQRLIRLVNSNIDSIVRSAKITAMYTAEGYTNITYVHRRGPYRRFRRAIDAGEKVIAIVGEPGMGKTALARGFALDEVGHQRLVELRGSSEGFSASNIALELEKRGFERRGTESPESALRRLIAEDNRRIVLVDDLHDWLHLDYLLPAKISSVLLITSRQLWPASSRIVCIPIRGMTRGEAKSLAASLRPDDSRVTHLGWLRLYGRPIAISQVCSYLAEVPSVNGELVIRSLQKDLVVTLDRIAVSIGERGLSAKYRALLDASLDGGETPHARSIVEVAACLPFVEIRSEILEAWIHYHVNQAFDPDVRSVAYHSVVALIRRYCLVSQTQNGLRMDELTQRVLREIFGERLEERCNEVLEAIDLLRHFLGIAGPDEEFWRRGSDRYVHAKQFFEHLLEAQKATSDVAHSEYLEVLREDLRVSRVHVLGIRFFGAALGSGPKPPTHVLRKYDSEHRKAQWETGRVPDRFFFDEEMQLEEERDLVEESADMLAIADGYSTWREDPLAVEVVPGLLDEIG